MSQALPIDAFSVVGLSHKTVPLDVRERLAIRHVEVETFYKRLLNEGPCDGALILSTCNRVEIYTVTSMQREVHQWIRSELRRRCDAIELSNATYDYNGVEAVNHLFRVTSGLDSMILGEPQIAGQVKESYAQAIKLGATNSLMNQLAHRAFNVAKKVRSETSIQNQPVSVPYTAVLLAEQIFGDLQEKKVLLIGAGQMSELAATHLQDRNIAELMLCNRDLDKANKLAERFNAAVWPFESLTEALDEIDIVITSTSSPAALLSAGDVRQAMRHRKNRPMFFIDLGVPRDLDPKINDLMNCYLFDIDDLQQVVDGNLEERQMAAREAEKLIRDEVTTFYEYLQTRDVSPVIEALMSQVAGLRENELDKLLRRYPELEGELKGAVAQAMDGVLKKVLHPTLLWLKSDNGDMSRGERAGIIERLFGIQKEMRGQAKDEQKRKAP